MYNAISKIGLLVLLCCGKTLAQEYPRWFLNQGEIGCQCKGVGYANPSFRIDASISTAVKNALWHYTVYTSVHLSGGQITYSTEGGMLLLDSGVRENIDTNISTRGASLLRLRHVYSSDNIVLVLLVDSLCSINPAFNENVSLIDKPSPDWIELLPKDDFYYYAVGLAPEYYYEASSWKEAEQMARRNLAASFFSHIRILQKAGEQSEALKHIELSASLHNVEVIARWRDVSQKKFYVLLRMRKE